MDNCERACGGRVFMGCFLSSMWHTRFSDRQLTASGIEDTSCWPASDEEAAYKLCESARHAQSEAAVRRAGRCALACQTASVLCHGFARMSINCRATNLCEARCHPGAVASKAQPAPGALTEHRVQRVHEAGMVAERPFRC